MDRFEKIAKRVAGQPVGRIRTAGKIEFVKDTGPVRRDIRVKDFDWSPECLRNLAKILWASQRAHSYAMSAYRLFSKMPSAEFSPDGLLGGRGYIQNVKDMRTSLSQTVEMLSSFTDTVHDEVNAEHWRSAEELTPSVQPMVEDAEQVKTNPEGFVEQEFTEELGGDFEGDGEEEEPEVVSNPDSENLNPQLEGEEEDSFEEEDEEDPWAQVAAALSKPKSKDSLPTDDSEQKQGKSESEITMHTTTPDRGSYAAAIDRVLQSHERRVASSAIDPATLPGPRVEHIGPGENGDPDWASDDLAGTMMGGGVNESDPLYEDWCADGVSGYEYPDQDDDAVAKDILLISSRIAAPSNYSWLPGADNNKLMPVYDRNVTPEQDKWMRENSQPDLPPSLQPKKARSYRDEYWEALRSE